MAHNKPLSDRESEVIKLLLEGKSNKLIAAALGISIRTVEFHLNNIYTKLGVSSRMELVLKLRNIAGEAEIKQLGNSTVERMEESGENVDTFNPQMDWATFSSAIAIISKELIVKAILKNPSAFLPLIMSFGALATVIIYVALFGTAPQADEGAAAHIWQILMAGQLPIIAFFAIKWLPQTPRQALLVLALQGGAAFMALAPVYLLRF